MSTLPTRTISSLFLLGLLIGCTEEDADTSATDTAPVGDVDLSDDEAVAIDAALLSLSPVRADLPVEDTELEAMANDAFEASRDDAGCEILGVVSGVWYDADLEPAFEGSWFKLGTGDQGGVIEGAYAEGDFVGFAEGDGVVADVTGAYADGVFHGEWESLTDDGVTGDGEMIGRYERRNDFGGYFFGLWGDCGR